jgi:23S rRNA A2030 N6-methylase RlmJ
MATLDVAAGQGLSSTGLLLCNAPFNFSEEWAATVPWLAQVLGRGPGARGEVVKLIGD